MTKDTIIEEPPVTAVAEYSPIAAGLAAARARYADVVWDLTTTRGNEEARRARKELVSLRTGLEAKRKEIKAPLLAQAKLVDDEARRITAELLQLEEPIDELIKADERRREEERAAREAAEKARVAAIQAKIKTIMDQPIKAVRIRSSALLRTAIDTLAAQEVDDSFEEFTEEARAAHAQALDAMREMLESVLAQEAEAERLRLEREAQERAAAEAAARLAEQERAARERRRAEEEAARATREAEERRLAAERAERERIAREIREAEEAEARAARAEADRIAREAREAEERRLAAERAEFERQQAEARAAQEAQAARLAAQQAEIERRAAELRAQEDAARAAAEAEAAAVAEAEPVAEPEPEQIAATAAEPVAEAEPASPPTLPRRATRPTDDDIIATLALHYRVHELKVIEWLIDMDLDAAADRAVANL